LIFYLAQCFHGDFHIGKCNRSLCHLNISTYNKERTFEPRCIPTNALATADLTITYLLNVDRFPKQFQCNLYCKYDLCNNAQVGEKLLAIIESHHGITGLLQLRSLPEGWENVEDVTTMIEMTTTGKTKNSVEHCAPIKTLVYFLHLFLGIHLF
jgi:hypothetical protein